MTMSTRMIMDGCIPPPPPSEETCHERGPCTHWVPRPWSVVSTFNTKNIMPNNSIQVFKNEVLSYSTSVQSLVGLVIKFVGSNVKQHMTVVSH